MPTKEQMRTVNWRDSHGALRVTKLLTTEGAPQKPYVLLLHGDSGRSQDFMRPSQGTFSYALRNVWRPIDEQTTTKRGELEVFPPPPAPAIYAGGCDPLIDPTGWVPFLMSRGFDTVTYDQAEVVGGIAGDISDELHAVMNWLTGFLFPRRSFFVLAVSRGGLLFRRWNANILPGAKGHEQRKLVKAFITLHSPHQGTTWANNVVHVRDSLRDASGHLDDALTASWLMALFTADPVVFSVAASATAANGAIKVGQWFVDMVYDQVKPDMQIGSAFLSRLESDEAAHSVSEVPTFTFGGTSTRLVRAWVDVFTPSSYLGVPNPAAAIIPLPGIPPLLFQKSTVRRQVASFFDGPRSQAVASKLGPEMTQGQGDLIVADARARLPWATHRSNILSHVETLTSPVLRDQVLMILQTSI